MMQAMKIPLNKKNSLQHPSQKRKFCEGCFFTINEKEEIKFQGNLKSGVWKARLITGEFGECIQFSIIKRD